MGLAASFIARLLQRHRWIAYLGLVIILYVAFDMCYRGVEELWRETSTFRRDVNV
jgi:predicted tellurium resistance membrane protein TerC